MNMIQPRFKDAPHFRDFWENGNGKLLIEFSGAKVSFEKFEKFEKCEKFEKFEKNSLIF